MERASASDARNFSLAHSKTTAVVRELSVEVKEAKGQLQEMQEDNDRGRASIQDKLKEFHRNVEDLQEQFKEAMEDFFEDVNDEPPAAVAGSTAKAAAKAPKAGPAAAKLEMEIEALKRGSDGGASVGDGGQVTADWAAALKEQTEALKEALSARGGQNSITSVKTDFVWPTLTDDKSDAKDVVLFYEEFEDVCALANNCRGMSARERLLALRARCKGSRQKTYTNAYRAAWKSGEVISDPEAVYLRIKNKHLREVRVDGEHQALTKGKLTGHQFEPLFEASIADLEAVGLGKTPRELYLSYLRKMPPHLQKEIRQDKRIWPGDGKDVGLRSPATWEESHKLVLEYEQREATEEEEEEDARARKEEAELRRGRDKRTTEEQEEFSDKGLFEKLLEAEEDYEAYLENENEYYTQSYTGPTKDDYPWEEEEEGEEGEGKKETKATAEASAGLTEEEQEEERKRKIKEINHKTKERAKEKEKEMEGFEYPHDYTKEWKEFSEDGQIYKQHYVTKEKIWVDRDWTYKRQKGGKGKKGKGKDKGEEGKAKFRQDLKKPEEAAAEQERRDRAAAAAAEEKKRQEEKAAAEEEERKKKEAAAEEKKKQAEKKQAEEEEAAAASGSADSERIKSFEKLIEEMMKERKADKARIEELKQEVESKGSTAGSQAPTADEDKEQATEGTTPAGAAAAEEEEDPERGARGPTGEDNYVKGQGRGQEKGSWFAVYSFQAKRSQWKWCEGTKFWYYYDGPNAVWLKQSKDPEGKEKSKCEGQAKQLDDHVKWLKENKEEKGEKKGKPAKEENIEKEEKQPETSDALPEPDDSVQLSGFTGGSASLNGTFVPDGSTVNGKQVYSQSQGDAGLECMWYHNGAWRIGSYTWFNSRELGRCHAYVKTTQDLGDIAPSETWMSCMGTAGGDPDVDKGLFQPQMSAKAAKLALDSLTRRSTSKKTSQVPVGGSTRLANILADQSWRHDFELPPMTPPSKERAQWRSQGSNEEVTNPEATDPPEKPATDS
eukprot:s1132_g1.t1